MSEIAEPTAGGRTAWLSDIWHSRAAGRRALLAAMVLGASLALPTGAAAQEASAGTADGADGAAAAAPPSEVALRLQACIDTAEPAGRAAACTEVVRHPDASAKQAAVALIYRCQAYEQAADLDRALEDCLTAIRLNPQEPAALNSLSVVYHRRNDAARAVEAADRALQLLPDAAVLYFTRSQAFCLDGNHVSAAADRIKAMELGLIAPEAMQTELQKAGFYKGAIDGQFGPASRAAMIKWARSVCK